MNLKKIFSFDLLELSVRIWTSFFLIIYGIGKLSQFEGAKQMDVLISDASGAQMMWAFFGTTLVYPIIIGCLQIIGAILLVFNRTKLISALLLTPLFLNIITLDILYGIDKGALLNAIIYQSIFLFIIIQQKSKIKLIFNTLILKQDGTTTLETKLIKFLIALFIAILLFFGFQKLSGFI